MLQNLSLGSNGGGLGVFAAKNSDATLCHKLVHWLHQFNPFCTKFRVVMKHWQIHPNTTKHTKAWVLGPMEWIRCVRCEKFQCDFMPWTCALILAFQPTLHRVSCINERFQNAPKHYKTHENMSLRSNGVDRVRPLPKIPMRLRGTNFCINCSSAAHFAPSFVQ